MIQAMKEGILHRTPTSQEWQLDGPKRALTSILIVLMCENFSSESFLELLPVSKSSGPKELYAGP